jgi:hypothetical protein
MVYSIMLQAYLKEVGMAEKLGDCEASKSHRYWFHLACCVKKTHMHKMVMN